MPGEKARILVVDDEEDLCTILSKRLTDAGYEVDCAADAAEALVRVGEVRPDVILLDIMMPGIDGIQLKERLGGDPSTGDIPVIFLTARTTTVDKITGLKAGADDYITKPFDKDELLARIEAVLQRRKFYAIISMTDGLTGLYNRHFFSKQMDIFFLAARRYKKIFSLAMVDIDNFKFINDHYGHAVGDFILKTTADIMKKVLRDADIVTRYGGDEFVIILPESNELATLKALQRLKEQIIGRTFIYNDAGDTVSFSISAGCAEYNDAIADPVSMFQLADASMYREKKSGQSH